MINHMLDEWTVDAQEFPVDGTSADKLRFLVRYAILAPSTHNVQPWQFVIADDHLELRRDGARRLPVLDPDDRELTMSCGAALYNLRVAARHFGFESQCELCPDPDDPTLLASVSLRAGDRPAREDEVEFIAIPCRHTNRRRYFDKALSDATMMELREVVEREGASLHVLDERQKRAAARLVFEADEIQDADRNYRHELAHWLHNNGTHRHDGMPGYAFRFSGMDSYVRPWTMRWLGWGEEKPYEDRELADDTPAMVVLQTHRDDAVSWMRAGQALERMLLRGCAEGLCVSWFNQAIEVPQLRQRVRELVGNNGVPQLLLGFGYGFHADATPRRPADEVIVDAAIRREH